ncbi:glycerophosphodiester phosphodiesterase [Brevundimonas naejangsanensis]|uniref:glycerophosphodiester phosphodiesterase n=1 Tax=Brevundimonas naejangsanensis TaxID=588932 RepID=UPI003208C57A
MADIASTRASVRAAFRDHPVDGVPASGEYEPDKREIRDALADKMVDLIADVAASAVAGRRVFATLAERDAWSDRPSGAVAYVEATKLTYRWSGTAWTVFEDPVVQAAERAEAASSDAAAAKTEAQAAAAAFNTLPLTPLITGTAAAPYLPDLDGANNRLTIPAGTILNTRTGQITLAAAANVDLSGVTSTAKKVYYNSAASSWVVKAYNTALTPAEFPTHHLVATVRRTDFRSQDSLTISCDATINGSPLVRPRTDRLCPVTPSNTTAPYLPNFDAGANTLTLPSGCVIRDGNFSFVLSSTAVIDLSVATSTAKKVLYDTLAGVFIVRDYSVVLSSDEARNCVLIAEVRRTSATSLVANNLSMACAYTVNGNQPGRPDRTYMLAALLTPLDSAVGTNAVSPFSNYPNYNTATDTFTLFQSTLISSGPGTSIALNGDRSVVKGSSSAGRIYYDTASDSLVWLNWNVALTPSQVSTFILIASVRKSNVNQTPVSISISCPYTIDGDLFGALPEVRRGDGFEGLAHRGWMTWAPENTLVAFRRCAQLGQMIVEGDIRWTSDNVPVLLHDPDIDRTTGGTGTGPIAGMTLATAKTFDFGSWKAARWAGEKIPTWAEFLRLAKKLNLYGYFEIKEHLTAGQPEILVAAIRRAGMTGRIQLHSMLQTPLNLLKALDPSLPLGLLTNSLTSANIAFCQTLKTAQNEVSVMPNHSTITEALVEEAHAAGVRVIAFTVNDAPRIVELAEMGVDGVMTDRLNVNQVLRASERMGG